MKKLNKSAKILSLMFGAEIIAAVSLWIYDEECLKPIVAQTFRIPIWRLIDIYIGRLLMWISIGGLLGIGIPISRINPKIGHFLFAAGTIISACLLLSGIFAVASISDNRAMIETLNIITKYPVICSPAGLLIGIGGTNRKDE